MPQEKKKKPKKVRGAHAAEARVEMRRLKRRFDSERKFHTTTRSTVGKAVHRKLAEKHETKILDKMRAINRKTREMRKKN